MRPILTESVVHYSQQRRQRKGHRTKKGGLPFILIYTTMTTSRHLNGQKEQKSKPPIALTAHKSMTTSFLPGLTRNVIVTCLPHALSKQGFGRQRRPLVENEELKRDGNSEGTELSAGFPTPEPINKRTRLVFFLNPHSYTARIGLLPSPLCMPFSYCCNKHLK